MKEIFSWTPSPGTKQQCLLPIRGGGTALPVTLLDGTRPGPRVLLSAGVHSAEYVGIQAALELAEELRPEDLSGSLAIIHLMNPTGFAHRTMSLVFEDGKNLNRVFPGTPDGTLSQRIAYTVEEVFFRHADAYIDLHSGDGYEELTPYVYCQGAADPSVAKRSRAMAGQADVPWMVRSGSGSGGAFNRAGALGLPGILLERGGLGLWTREEVDADKRDVRNILRFLGLLDGERRTCRPVLLGDVVYAAARFAGCWYPFHRAGDLLRAGEAVGEVRDLFGRVLETCTAKTDSVLLYQTKSLTILQDGPMAAYGALPGGWTP